MWCGGFVSWEGWVAAASGPRLYKPAPPPPPRLQRPPGVFPHLCRLLRSGPREEKSLSLLTGCSRTCLTIFQIHPFIIIQVIRVIFQDCIVFSRNFFHKNCQCDFHSEYTYLPFTINTLPHIYPSLCQSIFLYYISEKMAGIHAVPLKYVSVEFSVYAFIP